MTAHSGDQLSHPRTVATLILEVIFFSIIASLTNAVIEAMSEIDEVWDYYRPRAESQIDERLDVAGLTKEAPPFIVRRRLRRPSAMKDR